MGNLVCCPSCGGIGVKAIYLGFPMKICLMEGCNAVWGFWGWVPVVFPIECEGGGFSFFAYHTGYLKALWHWLRGCDGCGGAEE